MGSALVLLYLTPLKCGILTHKVSIVSPFTLYGLESYQFPVHFLLFTEFRQKVCKQDCIPVGCIPTTGWPYLGRGSALMQTSALEGKPPQKADPP